MSPRTLAPAAAVEEPLFEYEARRLDGSGVQGRGRAKDELELDRRLQSEGLVLVSARPARADRRLRRLRIGRRDLLTLTDQLATMLEAGVPLLQALEHLAEHGRTRQARRVVQAVLLQVRAGASLADAFASLQGIFPGAYVAMVRSGELSGSVPAVLRRQTRYLEWTTEVRGVARQALIHPLVLSLAVVLLVVILITFLIPALVGLLPGGRDDLPRETRLVLAVSELVRARWPLFLTGLAALVGSWAFLLRVPSLRVLSSRALLGLPRLGELLRMLAVARFAATAAALQHSGCEIVRTLELAAEACGNAFLRERVLRALELVLGGAALSDAMRRAGGIDPYLVQLTAVGETCGRLAESFDSIAQSYNTEAPRAVKWAIGLIEPAVMIVGGCIVAYLLLAALLPIFKVYETLG